MKYRLNNAIFIELLDGASIESPSVLDQLAQLIIVVSEIQMFALIALGRHVKLPLWRWN